MNLKIESKEITEMESRYRAHFINSLSGFKSANLIGTVDKKDGKLEYSWLLLSPWGRSGFDGFISSLTCIPSYFRKYSGNRILFNNHVNKDIKNSHQTSARYDKEESEFIHCKLNSVYEENLKRPLLKNQNKIGLGKKRLSA